MNLTESGITIFVNFTHPLNARAPILLRLFGKIISFNSVQPANASSPISNKLFGNVTFFKF